jgi:hypothetical protein
MASTTFIDQQTVIYAEWLNDVNNAVYNGSFPNGNINLTTLTVSGSVSGAGFTSLVNNTLSAPGAIGSVTPNTGVFTTLNATSALTLNSVPVVTTTGSQTLTNKTLTTPTVATVKSAASLTPTTFQDSAGNEIGTLCRAWVQVNCSTNPPTIRASFNVASVTIGTGSSFIVTFTNAMPDANYAFMGSANYNNIVSEANTVTRSTTAFSFNAISIVPNETTSPSYVSIAVFR